MVLLLALFSCRSTKYVADDSYLLQKTEIVSPIKDFSKQQISSYIRQRENVKILGFWRLHLGLYNLSGRNESKGFNQWLRRIGEEPVTYDASLQARSKEQLTLFLKNKGYLQATVSDTVFLSSKKKAKVKYQLHPGKRYTIHRITHQIEDSTIRALVLKDSAQTNLRPGKPFDADLHDQERDRITRRLHQSGFYQFNKDFIYFNVDSLPGKFAVNETMTIENRVLHNANKEEYKIPHQVSTIQNVYFILGFNPQKALGDANYFEEFDTIDYKDFKILYSDHPKFKPEVLLNSNYIMPQTTYDVEKVERTHSLLSSLSIFRFVNIRFREVAPSFSVEKDSVSNQILDCYIQLAQAEQQSYSFDIEGTNSSGNLGAASAIKYQHINLFRGAEIFQSKFRIATQNQFARDGKERFNTLETGADLSITFPKFLMPFRIESFRKRYNPNTVVGISYDYQRRPDFTRSVASTRLSYQWKASRHVWHTLSPIDFNLVNIPKISNEFQQFIDSTFLRYSYQDHFILNTNYTYLYNQQNLKKNQNFWYIKAYLESSGNLLNGIMSLAKSKNDAGYRDVWGIRYAQYVKADMDIRYHIYINKANSFAYRFFVGVGYPYGNLNVLPFEKSYFAGGANSIRAWPVRGLGPGSSQGNNLRYHNQFSDMRLELNAEYRFKLFWLLEGALFADAGNIWAVRPNTVQTDAVFHFNEFYKQIAIGVGFGARIDFNYFIFRIDTGIKARNPALPEGKRWVLGKEPIKWNDLTFNFAIGYPF